MSNVDILSKHIQELYDVRPSTAHMIAELTEMLANVINHECDLRIHEIAKVCDSDSSAVQKVYAIKAIIEREQEHDV